MEKAEKIDIQDLSIGDWVRVRMCKCDYDDPDTLDAKVLSIEGNSVGVGYDECGIVMSAFVDDLQPIPITAEVLEENGLECIEEDADTALYGTPSCSIFHTKGTLRYRLDTPQASVVCWNIHELQHALRLAKVGKEIVL